MTGKDSGVRRRKPGKTASSNKKSEERIPKTSGLCKKVLLASFWTSLSLIVLLFYCYKTSPITSVVIADMHDVRQLKWTQVNNSDLQRGQKLLSQLHGPESIVIDKNGNWYTGLYDGRVVKITNGDRSAASVIDISESLNLSDNAQQKRRPLGLRLMNNNLYVADAYQGLLVVNIQTLKWEKILAYDDVDPPMTFADDIAITKDEKTIYLTDVSKQRSFDESVYCLIEGECSGRVFKVDISTKHAETIWDNLCLANGIELDPTETKLILSENSRRRLIVVDIESREIVKKILLPGGPDNIRRSKKGGYWVGIPQLHDIDGDFTLHYPFIRDILVSLFSEEKLIEIGKLGPGVIVKLNDEFDPESIHYDMEGKVSSIITEVAELEDGDLLLGSFLAHGIAKVDGKPLG